MIKSRPSRGPVGLSEPLRAAQPGIDGNHLMLVAPPAAGPRARGQRVLQVSVCSVDTAAPPAKGSNNVARRPAGERVLSFRPPLLMIASDRGVE